MIPEERGEIDMSRKARGPIPTVVAVRVAERGAGTKRNRRSLSVVDRLPTRQDWRRGEGGQNHKSLSQNLLLLLLLALILLRGCSRSERQVDDVELAIAHVAGRVDAIEFLSCEGETAGQVAGIVPADQVLGDSLERIEIERRTRGGRVQVELVYEILQHIGVRRRMGNEKSGVRGDIGRHDS